MQAISQGAVRIVAFFVVMVMTASAAFATGTGSGNGPYFVLDPEDFRRHVAYFNRIDEEAVVNLVPNAESWDWMVRNVPFFEAPDASVEEIYYFRWWALRKHLKRAGPYYVYSEFIQLEPRSRHVPPELTISSALGHHFMETRWLRDQRWDDSYIDYWFTGNDGGPQPHFHRYSSWLHDALWQRYLVTGDLDFVARRFDRFVADYRQWQSEHQRADGLYWQYDVWDAMEESISGSREEKNVRPTINSYMYGNALALSKFAAALGRSETARELREEAAAQRRRTVEALWNPGSSFFEVVKEDGSFAGVREAIGFLPWYFGLPPNGQGYEKAWVQLIDEDGFWAPKGLTTAERRHPEFRSHGTGTCEWDGAVWPYATSQTLNALGNVLRDYDQDVVANQDFLEAFLVYTRAHRFGDEPYIGEYHDEKTGRWLKGVSPRSKFYHHSTYADLLIANLVGLRPRADGILEWNPLLPDETWAWFAVDGLPYRGRILTLVWDETGERYGLGAGMTVLVDGEAIGQRESLGPLEVPMEQTVRVP